MNYNESVPRRHKAIASQAAGATYTVAVNHKGCEQMNQRRILAILVLAGLSLGTLRAQEFLGAWNPIAAMPKPKSLHGVALGSDGRIYAIGGTSDDGPPVTAEVFAYDPPSDMWSPVAAMAGGARRNMAVTTDLNGLIYVIGGYNFGSPPFPISRAERYDPSNDSWTGLPDMRLARQQPAGATGADGRIYVMGGSDVTFHPVDVTEVFDPGTNQWTTVSHMNKARAGFGAATGSDGRIYVFGGYLDGPCTNSAEVYDPASDTWAEIAPMNESRCAVAGTAGLDGRIYAIGGYNASELNSVEVYDPASDQWSYVTPMSAARSGFGAATGFDGTIYAIGPGVSAEAFTPPAQP